VDTVEAFKNVVKLLGADAHSLIYDTDQKISVFLFFQTDVNLTTIWRIFDRIVEDISYNLPDADLVGHDQRIFYLNIHTDIMLFSADLDGRLFYPCPKGT